MLVNWIYNVKIVYYIIFIICFNYGVIMFVGIDY